MSEIVDLKGVGPATIEKLEEAGLTTLMTLAVTSPSELSTVTGLSEKAARKLIKQSRDNLNLGFEVATKFAKRRERINKLGTGCTDFDSILDGGFESGIITEVYGQYGSGKTQLAHLLVVRALAEDKDNKAIFLDTENTFRNDRIKDFAIANELDPEDVMNRIEVSRAYNSDHQMLLTEEVERMVQQDNRYKILVIDSLTSHFRAEYIGRGRLATRQQMLNKHMHQILKMADLYNLVVLCTNQVMANPGQFYGDPTTPIGGHIVGHNSTFRIALRPGKAGSKHAKLIDSPNLPQKEAYFNITKNGFENV